VATCLREELPEEPREEGPDAAADYYVHLHDDLDADDLTDLPNDAEAEEAAAEQRALMAPFEMQPATSLCSPTASLRWYYGDRCIAEMCKQE
jgi:hypothetical protein